ncbi:hypothetical protein [Cohnella faecalis]|nr:hypothetical protein [Cohnella faecalis]
MSKINKLMFVGAGASHSGMLGMTPFDPSIDAPGDINTKTAATNK